MWTEVNGGGKPAGICSIVSPRSGVAVMKMSGVLLQDRLAM